MTVKVVVVDAARLPAGVEFPPLEAEKYGWEQYPGLDGNDIAERCWRADIVVTLGAAIDSASLQKMHKLGLLICAAEACTRLDQDAARARGIELLAFPEAQLSAASDAQDLCDRVCAAINHYLRTYQPSEADT